MTPLRDHDDLAAIAHGGRPHLRPVGGLAPLALDDAAADLLFREAHTAYRFTDEPVSDAQMRAVHDLVMWAPTALNGQPMRVTLVRSAEARERLIARLAPGNRAKAQSAPLVAILSYDVDFHETLPEVLPSSPTAREGFADEAARHAFGSFNGALQAAYFMIGVRAAGLAAGPMGGFDRAGVDADFFPDGRQRSFLVVNIGHPAADGQFPRSPRLPYERVVSVA
jgi:3-hydroxypropanoate dehydrogenase